MNIDDFTYEKFLNNVTSFAYSLVEDQNNSSRWLVNLNADYLGLETSGITNGRNPKLKLNAGLLENPTQVTNNFSVSVEDYPVGQLPNSFIRIYTSNDNITYSEVSSLLIDSANETLAIVSTDKHVIAVIENNTDVLYSTEDLKKLYSPVPKNCKILVYEKLLDGNISTIGVYPLIYVETLDKLVVDIGHRQAQQIRSTNSYTVNNSLDASLQVKLPSSPNYIKIGGISSSTGLPRDYLFPIDSLLSITNAPISNRLSLMTLVESILFWGKLKTLQPDNARPINHFNALLDFLNSAPKTNHLLHASYNIEGTSNIYEDAFVFDNLYCIYRFLSSNIPELRDFVLSGIVSFLDRVFAYINNNVGTAQEFLIKDGYLNNVEKTTYLLKNQVLLLLIYDLLNYPSNVLESLKTQININYSLLVLTNSTVVLADNTYIPESLDYTLMAAYGLLINNEDILTYANNILEQDYSISISEVVLSSNENSPDYNIHYEENFSPPLIGLKRTITDLGLDTKQSLLNMFFTKTFTTALNIEGLKFKEGILATNKGSDTFKRYIVPDLFSTMLYLNSILENYKLPQLTGNIPNIPSNPNYIQSIQQFPTSDGVVVDVTLTEPSSIIVYAISADNTVSYDFKIMEGQSMRYTVALNFPVAVGNIVIGARAVRN